MEGLGHFADRRHHYTSCRRCFKDAADAVRGVLRATNGDQADDEPTADETAAKQ
jgi:hypothetical protein